LVTDALQKRFPNNATAQAHWGELLTTYQASGLAPPNMPQEVAAGERGLRAHIWEAMLYRYLSERGFKFRPSLGRVDGFDQDKGASQRDEGGEVVRGFLAAQGDTLEALDFADALFNAGAALVEDFGEEFGLGLGVLAVRDGGADGAPARRLAVGLGVVSLVAEHRSRGDVWADVEQDFEIAAVAGLAAG